MPEYASIDQYTSMRRLQKIELDKFNKIGHKVRDGLRTDKRAERYSESSTRIR
jgi:hypothetical protein